MPARGRARRRRGRGPASRRLLASTPDACGALKSRVRPRSSPPGTPRRQVPARGVHAAVDFAGFDSASTPCVSRWIRSSSSRMTACWRSSTATRPSRARQSQSHSSVGDADAGLPASGRFAAAPHRHSACHPPTATTIHLALCSALVVCCLGRNGVSRDSRRTHCSDPIER